MTHPSPLILSETDKLAEGAGRIVFDHPDRRDVIVKVHKPHRKKMLSGLKRYLRSNRRKYGLIMYSAVEIEEVARAVGHTGQVPDCVAQFMGFVNTNLGPAAMFEAVRREDGQLGTTLLNHAVKHGFEPQMEQAIKDLWDKIAHFGIAISDRGLANTVVVGDADTGYRLVIVDGLGDRTLIQLQRFGKAMYLTKWRKLRNAVLQDYRRVCEQ